MCGDAPGTIDVRYDNNLRVVSQKINLTDSVSFSYDRDGLLKNAGVLKIAWNPINGMFQGDTLGSITSDVVYSQLGELSGYEVRNGRANLFQTNYTRDSLGRITRLTETIQDSTTIFEYSYDAVGRLHEVKKNGVVTTTYFYDANGNRDSVATPSGTTRGIYDEQDRMLVYGSASYLYSGNGELRAKIVGIDTTWYQYDNFGNLVQVRLPDGTRIDYVIDAQNRRIGKKLNGRFVQKFIYSGQLLPVAELDSNNQVIARFMPGYMVKGGKTYRIISDHLGSIRLVVDIVDGSVVQKMDYNEFGNVIYDSNPGFQPFGYACGIYDQQTRLVRFGARDYDATTGQWTMKDPIGFRGGDGNKYRYVMSDPLNMTDPNGLLPDFSSRIIHRMMQVNAALNELIKGYNQMKKANVIGADKYFHCVASCRASRVSSPEIVDFLTRIREIGDNIKNRFTGERCPMAQAIDSMEDMEANRTGFNAPIEQPCENACSKYKVRGL